MSYAIESKKLKRLVDFYSPFNCGEELKFLSLFRGQQGLLRYLQTSSFQGIDSTSLAERTAWFGTNESQKPQSPSLRQIILSCLNNFGMKVYLFFSVLAIVMEFIEMNLGPYSYLGGILNLTMFMTVLGGLFFVSMYQNYENAKLKSYMFNGSTVKVWRDNERKEIYSSELVIGDIVELQAGDIVGADGIVIDGNLTVKEPLSYHDIVAEKCNTKQCLRSWRQFQNKITKFCLDEVEEEEQMPSPIILAGSQIISGDGRFTVLCVGRYSRIGNFVSEVHQAGCTRQSQLSKKIESFTFEVSKYISLAMVFMIILYAGKILAFIIIEKNFVDQNWTKVCIDLGRALTIILVGIPVLQVIGLVVGMFYMRFNIYQTDKIWYKYLKDCGTMKQITAIAFDKGENQQPLKLIRWWNQQIYMIEQSSDNEKVNEEGSENQNLYKLKGKFEQMFIESLKCKDFDPSEVGLKVHSLFLGMNKRFVQNLQKCLSKYAQLLSKNVQETAGEQESEIEVEDSKQSILRQESDKVQIVYIKGNSETLLKECTHILNPNTGRTYVITTERRQKIKQIIYQMNSSQEPSLITAYIEVHPNHPKFREPGYKVVMLSLIAYKENHDNLEFESLAKIKKLDITLTLIGNREHDETISMGKEMGLILVDKPSIQLTGYDFHKVVGGIICKSCKKSVCTCSNSSKYQRVLKNQDQFNRINKHLNVLSEANAHQKLALALGFTSAQEKLLFLGANINDVAAMGVSSISAVVNSQVEDDYARSAAEIILPDNKLATIEKLINWSYFYYEFCKKYIVFVSTPCLVAFVSNFICFLLYNNFCVLLIQFVWVSVVIFPMLGFTFALGYPPNVQTIWKKASTPSLIDKISSRQMSSQVITQVCLILIVLFFGPTFLPEEIDQVDDIIGSDWSAKYNAISKLTVCSGVYDNIFNNREQVYTRVLSEYGIYSRHMTFIFNLFVLMQFVNYFNCRSLNSSHNFLEGMTWTTGLGIVSALGLQILITFKGSYAMGLYPSGLTLKQWAICASMSLIVVLVGMLVKQIPYDNDNEQQKGKVWPNRCYNLAVMATTPKQSLQDFQIDQELQVKKMAMHME